MKGSVTKADVFLVVLMNSFVDQEGNKTFLERTLNSFRTSLFLNPVKCKVIP
jgi:hypothetical protein